MLLGLQLPTVHSFWISSKPTGCGHLHLNRTTDRSIRGCLSLRLPTISPIARERPTTLLQNIQSITFFYGSLRAPATLQRILDLPAEPALRPGQIVGYALGQRGDYPALVDGKQGQVVSGSAYLVQSEEQAQKLAHYETRAYKVFPCWIFFQDDKSSDMASGTTFLYAGDQKALLEQRFDRKLGALPMGGKLR